MRKVFEDQVNPVTDVFNNVLELLCFLDLCFEELQMHISSLFSLCFPVLRPFFLQSSLESFF